MDAMTSAVAIDLAPWRPDSMAQNSAGVPTTPAHAALTHTSVLGAHGLSRPSQNAGRVAMGASHIKRTTWRTPGGRREGITCEVIPG
jgi:hypothetical protein